MLSLLTLQFACTPADVTPTWAYDPVWLEPVVVGTVDGAVHGFQTWQLYGPRWVEKPKDRFYACAVVVEVVGAAIPCDAEPGCSNAWAVVPEVLQTDCSDAALADNPLFLTLEALALGGPAEGDVPHIGLTSVGYADYGGGWEVHGDAYPEALDLGGTAEGGWDGVEPFLFVPLQSFSVE